MVRRSFFLHCYAFNLTEYENCVTFERFSNNAMILPSPYEETTRPNNTLAPPLVHAVAMVAIQSSRSSLITRYIDPQIESDKSKTNPDFLIQFPTFLKPLQH